MSRSVVIFVSGGFDGAPQHPTTRNETGLEKGDETVDRVMADGEESSVGSKEFPDFDHWAVEYAEYPNRHEFTFSKDSDHPSAKHGRLVVIAQIGIDGDPMIAYLAGKRDAYAEDIRVSSPDDADLWQKRFDLAQKAVVAGKIKRFVAKARARGDEEKAIAAYAAERVAGAGISWAEMGNLLSVED